ncbi:MAG: hypothetical protein A3D28_00275 [Omnitrophica bacterium RIFCSPHIGHO2_02_FULL_63_14]|nr:MAG: hypothetical protein A3D28_00275 [Omnitrophica bacterium RIFCSPHIGHO2_02_FULL_63_14]
MAIIGRPLYDIAIMEAGPAGASLAFFLSRKGLRTFLWDRAEPGERPVCGGLPVALGSGAALAQRLSEGLNRRRPEREIAEAYRRDWTAQFEGRWRFARLLCGTMRTLS